MPPEILLSPKMPLVTQRGFALRHNREPRYASPWHRHDCAMLLWPQCGALDAQWSAPQTSSTARQRLRRGTALLLPPSAAHRTAIVAEGQMHGELYLAPELLRGPSRDGALQLDGAASAMLDALLAPTLDARSAEHLVRAVLAQCAMARPMAADALPAPSLVQRMVACIDAALAREEPLPTVQAIAGRLGVSLRTLQRACEAEATASPAAIRRRLLAARARVLLREGQSLAQVSQRLDFSSSGHVTRLLKAVAE